MSINLLNCKLEYPLWNTIIAAKKYEVGIYTDVDRILRHIAEWKKQVAHWCIWLDTIYI